MITLNDVNVGEQLGIGMVGTVYLGQDASHNKYAVKIEPIPPKNVPKTLASNLWREIEFAQTMHKLYPNHFMKLYDHKIDDKCKYKHNWDSLNYVLKDLPKPLQNSIKKTHSSTYCSVKLYSFVDTTLHHLLLSWETFDSKLLENCLFRLFMLFI